MKTATVSALIPAYNEEKSIKSVLIALKAAKKIDEIICINDGSSDKTLLEIQKVEDITILNMKKNKGKSYAIVEGIKAAKGDIIVFIDADIKGEIAKAADALVTPLIDGTYDVTVGYPLANSFDKFFRPLSGERAYFKHDLLKVLDKLEQKGYGMELFLNHSFKDKRIKCFPMKNVLTQNKLEKQTYSIAFKLTVVEALDILTEVLSQKNPSSFFLRSYIYSFYLKKPTSHDSKIDKMIEQVRDYIKKQVS